MPFWGYLLIILVAFLGIIYFFLISATGKGTMGELEVQNVIGKTIPGEQYVINNLMLSLGEKKTCQIDHVLINNSGVFVIETKNYSGTIYGEENNQNWTQVLTRSKKNKFYNPVKQNKTHIYHISNVLSEDLPIFSVVVFVKNNIKSGKIPGVYNLNELKEAVSKKGNTITLEQMKKAYHELLQANVVISSEKHTKNVKTMLNNIDTICPRCGKKLVERNGKNGVFMGCSGYPQCRFTKNK